MKFVQKWNKLRTVTNQELKREGNGGVWRHDALMVPCNLHTNWSFTKNGRRINISDVQISKKTIFRFIFSMIMWIDLNHFKFLARLIFIDMHSLIFLFVSFLSSFVCWFSLNMAGWSKISVALLKSQKFFWAIFCFTRAVCRWTQLCVTYTVFIYQRCKINFKKSIIFLWSVKERTSH